MAAKQFRAVVTWLHPEAGGRQAPPAGPTYATVAGFGDALPDPDNAWSLVLDFESQPDSTLTHCVRLRFLSSNAPVHLLHKGSHFRLFEGRQPVAWGEVCDEMQDDER